MPFSTLGSQAAPVAKSGRGKPLARDGSSLAPIRVGEREYHLTIRTEGRGSTLSRNGDLRDAARYVPRVKGVETMPLWEIGLVIAGAGGLGGVINAFTRASGFKLPKAKDGLIEVGCSGHVIAGAAAAFVSWGLYGQYAGSG